MEVNTMGSTGYLRTIEDMERLYYGAGAGANAWAYSGTDLLKADSPLMSSTAGTYQAIFGRKVWSQLNQEFNAFSILPKKPWEKSGWRVVTDKPDITKGGGVAENGTLPETSKPSFAHVNTKPMTVAHTFDLSETAMFLADKDDGLGDARAVMKMEMAKHHAEHINKMLLEDVDTLSGNDFDSLDRATSSSFTETATDFVSAITDHNMYNLTRNGAGAGSQQWYDSNVDAGAAGANRALSLNILDGMFRNIWERGGQPKVILTGYDTLEKIQQLLQPQQRFTEMKRVVPGVNGVKGVPGMEAGFVVATYNGVPIIPSKDVQNESSGAMSRMYFLDTDYMYFCTAKPTLYHESGIETGDPFGINRLGQMGLFHTMGDLWQLFYGAHGKIRDITA
tara:strand:- start:1527 stop:2705 length:1179 start_codon:yes stop_codon:yes gene_type:complete